MEHWLTSAWGGPSLGGLLEDSLLGTLVGKRGVKEPKGLKPYKGRFNSSAMWVTSLY